MIETSPIVSAVFDVIVVAVLSAIKPEMVQLTKGIKHSARPLISFSISLFAMVIISISLLWIEDNYVHLSDRWMLGKQLKIAPFVNIGECEKGSAVWADVEIANKSNSTIHVIGATSDCSVISNIDMPFVLKAMESRMARIRLQIPAQGASGYFGKTFRVWSDYGMITPVSSTIVGFVR